MSTFRVFLYTLLAMCSFGVHAVQSTVMSTGTVSSSCSFTANVPGTLAVSPSAADIISTQQQYGGTSASVGVSYLGTPSIEFLAPTSFDNAPSEASSLTINYGVSASSSRLGTLAPNQTSTGVSGTYAAGNSDTISVDMWGSAVAANIPLGQYQLSSVMTCQ